MIVFLTLVYVGLLALLAKLKIVKWTLWWKLSPIVFKSRSLRQSSFFIERE